MSGSEVEVWNNRDTSSGGYQRNDEGERAATGKEHGRLRASRRKNDQDRGGAGLLAGLGKPFLVSGQFLDGQRPLLYHLSAIKYTTYRGMVGLRAQCAAPRDSPNWKRR